jgi:hypothetical protein
MTAEARRVYDRERRQRLKRENPEKVRAQDRERQQRRRDSQEAGPLGRPPKPIDLNRFDRLNGEKLQDIALEACELIHDFWAERDIEGVEIPCFAEDVCGAVVADLARVMPMDIRKPYGWIRNRLRFRLRPRREKGQWILRASGRIFVSKVRPWKAKVFIGNDDLEEIKISPGTIPAHVFDLAAMTHRAACTNCGKEFYLKALYEGSCLRCEWALNPDWDGLRTH